MDDEQLKGKATKLWHETGTIMIRPDWLKSELDKMLLTTVATMLYGEREG